MNKEKLIKDLENQHTKNLNEGLRSALSELVRSVKAVDDNVLESNFLYGTFPTNFKVSNMKRITIIEKIIEVFREQYPSGTPVMMKLNNNTPIPIDEAISNVSSELENTATVENFLDKIKKYRSDIVKGEGTNDMANVLVTILYKIDEQELSKESKYVLNKIGEMFKNDIKSNEKKDYLLHFFTEKMRHAIQRNGRISNTTSKGLQIVRFKLDISGVIKKL